MGKAPDWEGGTHRQSVRDLETDIHASSSQRRPIAETLFLFRPKGIFVDSFSSLLFWNLGILSRLSDTDRNGNKLFRKYHGVQSSVPALLCPPCLCPNHVFRKRLQNEKKRPFS
jgi:hypothetical protein